MTLLWTRLVVSALEATSDADAFDAFVAQHPELSDREYPLSFYSKSRLMSDRARAEWIEPDLRPLPCGVAVFADTPREIVVRFPQYHSANVAFDAPHRRH